MNTTMSLLEANALLKRLGLSHIIPQDALAILAAVPAEPVAPIVAARYRNGTGRWTYTDTAIGSIEADGWNQVEYLCNVDAAAPQATPPAAAFGVETIISLKSDEQASLSPGTYQVLTKAVSAAPQATPPAQSAPPAAAEQSEPAKPAFTKTRSIIHDCPAIKLPQTFLQRLGNTAQLVVLKGADDDLAEALIAMLNAPPAAPAPAPTTCATPRICGSERRCAQSGQAITPGNIGSTMRCAESGAPAPAPQPLTRQQIDDVMTKHYPLDGLLRENVDAFEACVRDIEAAHGITGGATGGKS